MHDENGQPVNSHFNARRRSDRDIDELLGLCKGLASDKVVNSVEAGFLLNWLALHEETTWEWPGDILYARLQKMLRDGVVDSNEEAELISLLVSATGGDASKLNAQSLSADLPLDNPPPTLMFPGKEFCFTGKFLLGPRKLCEEQVFTRGGRVSDSIKQDVSYLVVGVIGSRDWAHSAFGRKIEKAVEYRKSGVPLAIVSEEHFVRAIR